MIATDLTAPTPNGVYSLNGHTPPAIDKELLALEASFAKKLACTQAQVSLVPKDSKSEKYDYSSVHAILNMLRPLLAANKLAVWIGSPILEWGDKAVSVHLPISMIDGDTGYAKTASWSGLGFYHAGMERSVLIGSRYAVKNWATCNGLISSAEDEDQTGKQGNRKATPTTKSTAAHPAEAASQKPTTNKPTKFQVDKMVDLYAEIYNVEADTALAGVDAMLVKQFGHGLDQATYNEGAHITARLLELQRQASLASTPGEPHPATPPPPPAADVPMEYRSAPKLVAQLNTVFQREGVPFQYDNHIHLTNALGLKSYKSAQDAAWWNQVYADALAHGRAKQKVAA